MPRGMLPLDEMSHADLYRLRARAGADQQGMLAPHEHRAFAAVYAGYHGLTEGMLNRLVPSAQAAPRRAKP